MSSRPKGSRIGLSRRYSAALRKRLALGPASSLRPAESLGREALADGLDILHLAEFHKQALVGLLPAGVESSNGHGMIALAATFFSQALTPIENAHRTA